MCTHDVDTHTCMRMYVCIPLIINDLLSLD